MGDKPIHEAVQDVLELMGIGVVMSADVMLVLSRDRGAELAAIPAATAVALVRKAVEVATKTLEKFGVARAQSHVLGTLRRLLALSSLRKVAAKASRLRSLATAAMLAPPQVPDPQGADAAASAVLQTLRDAGVDIACAGMLQVVVVPFTAALRLRFYETAQVRLDAGADVNGLSPDGSLWPLAEAAIAASEQRAAWLLERGASLTRTNARGRTIVHVLATRFPKHFAGSDIAAADRNRWLRHFIDADPSLLEARDGEGLTPLLSAAGGGSEACVATLLGLGADLSAVGADHETALAGACNAASLPVVRQLIAAGAASVAVLPPGSQQARAVSRSAVLSALRTERGCGECAGRCGGSRPGNCAEGLDILRAVLAAGVREAVGPGGYSLVVTAMITAVGVAKTNRVAVSPGNVLAMLQALHAAGLDVLARGPSDEQPVFHVAVSSGQPTWVRWLVTEAKASLEEDNSMGCSPLLVACTSGNFGVAHTLLDYGARVDVQSAHETGMWPVMLAAQLADTDDCALLRRILSADRDSLLRRSANGWSVIHGAMVSSTAALKLLLASGLPHLTDAINALGVAPTPAGGKLAVIGITPLHGACHFARWDAALALLSAGARVDIAGDFEGRVQTVAQWARSSPECKHRGVKLAIAARAREHAAQAAAAAKDLPSGGAASGAGAALASASATGTAAAQHPGSARSASGAAGASLTAPAANGGSSHAGAGAAGAAAATPAASGKRKPGRARKGKSARGAASNRAEESGPCCDEDDAAPASIASKAAAPGSIASKAAAASAAAETAGSAALNTCEEPSSAGAATLSYAAEATSTSNLVEDPSAAAGGGAAATPSAISTHATPSHEAGGCVATAARRSAANTNTCEPGEAAPAPSNTCEPGEAAPAPGINTCEEGGGASRAEAGAITHASTDC
jgi:ankyrin repeat protein